MKTEIVKTEQSNQEIDWSKPMLVKCDELVVCNLGESEIGANNFKGLVLIAMGDWEFGQYYPGWSKSQFTPITEPVTIKFIP